MGGFHALDLIVIAGVILLIFGPKTLQSLSHSAGRTVTKARDTKDKMLAEIPMEDFSSFKETVSQIPLSPQQVAQKLLFSPSSKDQKSAQPKDQKSIQPVEVLQEEPIQVEE